MRNYIILNGQNSNEITGLIIQELPPISKPKIRAQIDEIDGRDGDIVTKLGYGAYDKEIIIGLYNDYDIDEIIAFFNSEGTVVFSNEEEKYYNYQILNQIDFERLVRYRTATVTFHVEPFKYSTEESERTFNINLLKINNFTETTNDVTLEVTDGVFSISGTSSSATEFYVPISTLNLASGDYTLNAKTNGTGSDACSIRIINNSPSDANTFGGTYITLQDDDTSTLSATLSNARSYNYIWFYITANNEMDFTLNTELTNDATKSINIRNNGNYISKPIITINGSGTINLSLNDHQIFVINLGDYTSITLDIANMEAYGDGILMNRLVTGNYNNFALNVGLNTISWTGDVTEINIENYSRWI